MICPGCAASLTGKERTGRVCARCGKRFALDPAVHGTGMHDIRIRGIAERATDHGRLKITLTQLWYLSRTHNYAWAEQDPQGVPTGIRWLVALPVAVALLLCAVLTDNVPALVTGAGGCAVLVVASALRHRPGRPPRSQIIPSEETFRQLMTGAWSTAYGRLPKGVVDDARPVPRRRSASRSRASAPSSRPTAVILCTDRVAALFLTANDIPGRLGAVLLEAAGTEETAGRSDIVAEALKELAKYRSALPVVVLHDADPLGVLLAPLIRAAQPDRVVVDAGLPVSAARGKQGVVRLARHDRFADAEQLRTVAGLSGADAEWLADGFWSPIAAVPPRLLESIVVRAVERALAAPLPGPRDAHTNGFLTWPQAPQTPGARDTGRPGAGTSKKKGPRSV
ncbi:hypothetical protein [Streptomyces sp. Ncost-T10-10d]|uniref:hypothetical protein n=1 Tax=Streptomyces sp. Ncost-T10-10d TaxID=1839774 RepID=UPI00081E51AC|nr:hypothetical protein [Streptomyces sp. Ncost-T10-10d]SCF86502.1 hypothetical protein GA0115254_120050 [Streptomyces sp. Ncost-T10-10d]